MCFSTVADCVSFRTGDIVTSVSIPGVYLLHRVVYYSRPSWIATFFCLPSSVQELWKDPRLHVPFSLGITPRHTAVFIGSVPIDTSLLFKPVAESFGTNCDPLRVSVKLLTANSFTSFYNIWLVFNGRWVFWAFSVERNHSPYRQVGKV